MNTSTVLYVEDEEDDILFMRMAFKRAGLSHRLEAVCDGEKAIAYLAGKAPYTDRNRFPAPGLVLLDLNLPLVNGFEVLQWMRQQLMLMPVLIFSSSGRQEDRDKARELGASGYFQKPASGLDFVTLAREIGVRWPAVPGALSVPASAQDRSSV